MNGKIVVPIILLLVVGVVGFFMYTSSQNSPKVGEGHVDTQNKPLPVEITKAEDSTNPLDSMDDSQEVAEVVEESEVLNTGVVKYQTFTKADYEQALDEGKTVLLQFYAIWCPTCIAEEPELIKGTDQLSNPDLVLFRVNYKDDETSEYEADLAEQFDVGYQHTKVIIKDGDVVFNEQEIWTADDVVENLGGI